MNGQVFLHRATELDFALVRKTGHDPHQLESLLFGHFGLLDEEDCTDAHYLQLKKEYDYLVNKFGLSKSVTKPEFFGLRPANFPTIRISQLAQLYNGDVQLFSKYMGATNLQEIYDVFDVCAGPYWDNHFTFGKVSKKNGKRLSRKFIDLLVINTLFSMMFCYSKYVRQAMDESLIDLISAVGNADNSIIANFYWLGPKTMNAYESQAKL